MTRNPASEVSETNESKGECVLKFKPKPRTDLIEANQYTKRGECPLGVFTNEDGSVYVITMHEVKTPVEIGDWIVIEPGSDGTRAYPIKDHVFKDRYEPA